VTSKIFLNKWQHQQEKDYQHQLEEEEYECRCKEESMKENKLSHIRTVLSSNTIGTKV